MVVITLLVAVAGGLGSLARFVVDGLVRSRVRSVVPAGTFVINVSGSLALGFLSGLVIFHAVPDAYKAVIGTGFLGGYTTFSTASVETFRLLQERRWMAALANGFGMLVLALAGAAAGMAIAAAL